MATEARTNVVIGATTKGMSEAAQAVNSLAGAAAKAVETQAAGFEKAEKKAGTYAAKLKDQTSKVSMKDLQRELDAVTKQFKQLSEMGSTESIQKELDALGKRYEELTEQIDARKIQAELDQVAAQFASLKTAVPTEEIGKDIDTLVAQFGDLNEISTEDLRKQIEAIGESTEKAVDSRAGIKQLGEEWKDLEDQLESVRKQQLVLSQAMSKVDDKAGPAYKNLTAEMKRLRDEGKRVEDQMKAMDRQFGRQMRRIREMSQAQRQSRGAFTQGMLQGAIPGAFLQRGPGMYRQAAGMMVGQTMGGVARGMMSSPFTGAQGIGTAAGAISPVLAGQIQTGLGLAGQALGVQRQRLDLLPSIGGPQQAAEAMAARRRAMGRVRAPTEGLSREEIEAQVAARGDRAAKGVDVNLETIREGVERQGVDYDRYMKNVARRYEREELEQAGLPEEADTGFLGLGGENIVQRGQRKTARINARRKAERDLLRNERSTLEKQARDDEERAAREELGPSREDVLAQRREEAGRKASRKVRRETFGTMRNIGVGLGFAEPEVLQRRAAVSQTAGGFADKGFVKSALEAERVFGVQGQTSGAFLRGARRGGIAGEAPGVLQMERGETRAEAQGRIASKQLESALTEATKLGLEGSEINDYMQQMASGIQQFQQTGIPFAKKSVAEIGSVLNAGGLMGGRGAGMSMALTQGLQGLSRGGPQSATDLLMMQAVGGYEGGGIEEFEAAQERLEQGDFGKEEITKMFGKLFEAGGGGAGGRFVARRALAGKGVNLGIREAKLLQGQQEGTLDETQMKELATLQAEREQAATAGPGTRKGGLSEQASEQMAVFGGSLVKQARLMNRQIASGERLIPTMQNLEDASSNMTKALTSLGGDGLAALTNKVAEVSDNFAKMATGQQTFMDSLTRTVDTLGLLYSPQ